MITPKKLINMARKWQKLAALSRKRISFPRSNGDLDAASTSSSTTSSMVDEGHFVVYTVDQKRFVMPLSYLNNYMVRELFRMSEEEFGLSSDGPITLPCDTILMEYVITLIRRGVTKDLEKALLKSIDTNHSALFSSVHQGMIATQATLVCGY